MENINLNNEVDEVVEVATEIAEDVAVEEVAKTVNFKKVGIAALITGGVIVVAGVVIKKRKDIADRWHRFKNKHSKSEESFDTIDVEVVADDVTEE